MANHFTKSGDYYVSAIGGNDSNAGTDPDAPMKTISVATAAAEAAAATGTIIVGTGIYVERITATNTSDAITIQGDGNVIIDGTGQVSSIYQGNDWNYKDLIFVNCAYLFSGSSIYFPKSFTRCKFKNIPRIADAILSVNNGSSFTNCVFNGMRAEYYCRYFKFQNCTFINGNPTSLPGADSGGLSLSFNNCIFSSPSGSVIASTRYFWQYGTYLTDCVFTQDLSSYGNDAGDYSTAFDLTQEYLDNNPKGIVNCYVASMSFNDNISGSGDWNLIPDTMPLNATTKVLYSNTTIVNALGSAGGFAPRTAYGEDVSSANPLHTEGGATWDNIMTGSLGGFQISASTSPTGTITTAVIDQGSSKVVKSIGSAWTTTAFNAAAPSTYPSGALNHNPTRYQYEMRYGNSTPAGDYSIFEWDTIPYVNSNGTGSGDQLFSTSSYTNVTGRYLQLKITLRNDMSGSA